MKRRAGDLGLWAVLGLLVLGESGARGDPYWFRAGCLTVLAAGVLLRRPWPLVALAIVGGTECVIVALASGTTYGVPIALVPAIVLLSYLSGRRESQLRYFLLVVSWELVGVLVLALLVHRTVATSILNWLVVLLFALLTVVLPWLIGRYRAQQALLASAGWERAERIEREHGLEIDRERLRERSRIAEDMHDSVGHELSLIALRAAALEIDAELPERQRRAAGELREAAATATERLGEIIGVLRDPGAEAPVIPARESVPDLVERAVASGLAVHLVQQGDGELAPMVDRAVHRVVQESLTNAGKHAPGASITVSISHETDQVVVRIANGAATKLAPQAVSTGRGLAGLRERVRLVGGVLDAAPRSDGGFEVVAQIPRIGGKAVEPEIAAAAEERDVVRRRARRGLITAVAAPLAVGAVIGVVALGYYLVVGYNSILEPAQYEKLELGQSVAEVEELLPRLQMVDPPAGVLPEPAQGSCRYYRPDAPFSITYAYRLCFHNDRLVAKDVVQTGSRPPTPEGAGR
ncbi:histidine kinase [Kribbella sp. NPDC006257]|uniref:sensor histidine kinase n=1 Tax=Kribbella sp. NPDC006257 TaxID=3156738 RepID=UPI0033BF6BDF